MATSTETVILKLEDQVSRGAKSAEGALGRLERQIVREQSSLQRLEAKAMAAKAELAKVGDAATHASRLAKLGAAVDAIGNKKDRIEALRNAIERMQGKTTEAAAKAASKQSALVEKLNKAKLAAQKKLSQEEVKLSEKSADAATGFLAPRLAGLARSFAAMGPYVMVAVVAVLAWTAAVSAAIALVAKGISITGEYRDEWMKLRATIAETSLRFRIVQGTILQANELQAAINRVSSSSATARGDVADFAGQLYAARFRGKALEQALNTMSTAAAGGGKQAAASFLEQARMARLLGVSLDKVRERYDRTYGPIAKSKLLSLDTQLLKFKENISRLFQGFDAEPFHYVEPFLRGLQAILSLFGQDSKGAQDLRSVIVHLVEKGIGLFLRFEIVLLKTYIWIREHDKQWKKVSFALGVVGTALGLVAGLFGLIAVAGAVAVALVLLPLIVLATAIYGVIYAIRNWGATWEWIKGLFDTRVLLDPIKRAVEAIITFDAKMIEFGQNLMAGIAQGIRDAAGAVWEALKSSVGGAFDKVKNLLGIHSPSVVARMQVGRPISQGAAIGIEQSIPEVRAASQNLAQAAIPDVRAESRPVSQLAVPAQAASSASSSGGASSPSTSPTPATFTFSGCTFGAGLTEDILRVWMHRIFEEARLNPAAS